MCKIKDSMTTLFIPIGVDWGEVSLMGDTAIWERTKLNINRHASYPHIRQFLVGNIEESDSPLNLQNCVVYSLKEDWAEKRADHSPLKSIFEFNSLYTICLPNGESSPLYFRLLNKRELSLSKTTYLPSSICRSINALHRTLHRVRRHNK